jgi:hypothetical protein
MGLKTKHQVFMRTMVNANMVHRYKNWQVKNRLKRVVKGQIWYYDVHTRLYRTDLKEINLNRKQRQSVKNRCKL